MGGLWRIEKYGRGHMRELYPDITGLSWMPLNTCEHWYGGLSLRHPAVAKSGIVWVDGKFLLISEEFAVSIRTSETAAGLKFSLTTLGVSFRPNLVPIGTVEKVAAAPSA